MTEDKVSEEPQPSLLVDSFELLRLIGTGGFGQVYLIEIKDAKRDPRIPSQVVLKRVNRVPDDTEAIDRIMRMEHQNVLKPFWYTTREATILTWKCFDIFMEYCPGGDMSKIVADGVPWDLAVEYARQILSALHFLHTHNLVHGDIKPKNILFSDQHPGMEFFQTVKVADTDGLYRLPNGGRSPFFGEIHGEKGYYAPERVCALWDECERLKEKAKRLEEKKKRLQEKKQRSEAKGKRLEGKQKRLEEKNARLMVNVRHLEREKMERLKEKIKRVEAKMQYLRRDKMKLLEKKMGDLEKKLKRLEQKSKVLEQKKEQRLHKMDIWSFGVAFRHMMYGQAPKEPYQRRALETFFAPRSAILPAKSSSDENCRLTSMPETENRPAQLLSHAVEDVIDACMEVLPDDRPVAEEILNFKIFTQGSAITDLTNTRLPKSWLKQLRSQCTYPCSMLKYCPEHTKYTEISVWFIRKNQRLFGAFDRSQDFQYDHKLLQAFQEDLPRSLKLLHEHTALSLHLYSDDEQLPANISYFGVFGDMVTTLVLCHLPCDPLPSVFMPNLILLCLRGCKDVALTQHCLLRYPKLVTIRLGCCSFARFENNFLEYAESLQHFHFYPQLTPTKMCQKYYNRKLRAKRVSFVWLSEYLKARPELITENMNIAVWKNDHEEVVFDSKLSEADTIQHTLECPRCSAIFYGQRFSYKYKYERTSMTMRDTADFQLSQFDNLEAYLAPSP